MLDTSKVAQIERICFNFQRHCNMECPYCYIPFDASSPVGTIPFDVVDRCAELGVKVITFGGGDPFLYSKAIELFEYTRKAGIEVHVDTNGINLKPHHFSKLQDTVNLIALPFDGPTAAIHDGMRNWPGHFDIVWDRLNRLVALGVRLKVNTLVCQQNSKAIAAMATQLPFMFIDIWSLYQFWPLITPYNIAARYEMSSDEFDTCIGEVPDLINNCRVERNSYASRHNSYFFVSQDGVAYTHDTTNKLRYSMLGSIFDDRTVENWRMMNITSMRTTARNRYPATEVWQ